MGFPDSSVGKESACNAGNPGLIPGLGRSPGEGIGYSLQYSWASLLAQLVKNPLEMRETWVWCLGWEDPLEKWKATLSSILDWKIPHGVTKSQTLWATFTSFTSHLWGFSGSSEGKESTCNVGDLDPWVGKIFWKRRWLPTPVFLLGDFHGQRSLVGYSPWGCKEWDTTEWWGHFPFIELPPIITYLCSFSSLFISGTGMNAPWEWNHVYLVPCFISSTKNGLHCSLTNQWTNGWNHGIFLIKNSESHLFIFGRQHFGCWSRFVLFKFVAPCHWQKPHF